LSQEEEDQNNQLEADWEVPQKVLAPEKIWESDSCLAWNNIFFAPLLRCSSCLVF
jgi:hypothetical protein